MFTKQEKIALVVTGIEIVGCIALSIYCYGMAKFYEGRISKYNELKPTLDALHNELKRTSKNSKEES